MTLLEIVAQFCRRTGLGEPQIVMSSQDDTLLQIVGLANELCEDLVARHNWSALQYEATFTSVSGGDQGALTTLAPYGVYKVLNDTIYDRTRRLPVFGPRSPEAWQAIKALPMSGPFYQYRFRGGHLLVTPDMPAGHSMAFEYQSRYCVLPTTGVAASLFTRDDDEFLLDPALLLKGLRWKWKEEKGLPYAEDFRRFETALANAIAADGTKAPVKLDDTLSPALQPGIFVPAGNWSIP